MTGFIESNGNFYCGFDLNYESIAKNVKCYMRISQKKSYKLNSEISDNQNTNLAPSPPPFRGRGSNWKKKGYNFFFFNLDVMEKIRKFLNVKMLLKLKELKRIM